MSTTGQPRPPGLDPTAVVLAVLALLAAASAVAGELLLRAGIVLIPAPVAVLDASMAWIFLALAIARAGAARSEHESPQVRRGIRRVVLGTCILYPSLALVGPLQEWISADAAFAIDAVSTIVALPLLISGIVGLCWPPGFSKTQSRVLLADALVGSLGMVVLWLVIVLPVASAAAGEDAAWAGANALFMFCVAVLLVVLITASRRRALIPARQVMVLHAAVALHLAAGLLDLLLVAEGAVTTVRVFYLGAVLGGAMVLLFLLTPSGQTESLREGRAREIYAATVPLLPIPVASLALVGVLAAETEGPEFAEILGGVLLILVLLSVVVLRALASAELRGAAREKADIQLSSSTEEVWFQALVGRASDLTLVVRRDGRIVYSTPSVHQTTGLTAKELRDRSFSSLLSKTTDRDASVRSLMGRADVLAGEPTDPVDMLLHRAGGGREVEWQFTALVGLDMDGYLIHGRDVTEDRRMRALLAESDSRDTLTGLFSRNGFVAATADRTGKRCVLVFNLRRFSDYNDLHGHAAGDHVLRQVAAIMRELPGPVFDPVRLSGDTFAVLVTGAVPDIEVVSAAAGLRSALKLITLPDGRSLPLAVAAGYAVSDADETSSSELLSRAELAMMRSRSLDRSPLVRFDPTLRLARDAAAVVEADLRSALRERALVVRYQPIVRLTDGAVVGAEALVRRRRADGSLESPDVFIPLAEQLGLVDEVDYAVLMRALSEMRQVAQATGRTLPVSVNVSASELDDGLEHRVLDALATTGWQPEHLIIEVTETALATRTDEAGRLLRRLQRAGCLVAMDDFGTGYSSMASLVEMPVDIVKIDASFTHRLTAAGRGLSVMRAIVEIGRSLNLVTVAEGLASIEQADLLRGMGCDRGQGYLYAPPLSAEEFVEFLLPDSPVLSVD